MNFFAAIDSSIKQLVKYATSSLIIWINCKI